MHPILIIARLTFREAIRRRIVLAGLLLGGAFLVLYGLGFYFIQTQTGLPAAGGPAETLLRRQVFNFLTMVGMYAVNFLCIAMGALLSADTLAGEIGSGTIQAIVTKPVRRADVVLGKWLGFAGLLGLYLLMMTGGLMGMVYAQAGFVVPNPVLGVSLIYLNSLMVMSVTLALSSTFSALATGGAVFGLYGLSFIGGWVEQVGAVVRNSTAVNVGIVSSLIIPTEALLRRAAYEMTSPAVQSLGLAGGPILVVSVPSPLMVVYAALYAAGALGLALRAFSRRDL